MDQIMRRPYTVRRPSKILGRVIVLAIVVAVAVPLVKAGHLSPDRLKALPGKAMNTLDRLAEVFDIQMNDSVELNGELATGLQTFEDIGTHNAQADEALSNEDPFVVVERDRFGESVEPTGHRYAPPDMNPELVEASRILRASF